MTARPTGANLAGPSSMLGAFAILVSVGACDVADRARETAMQREVSKVESAGPVHTATFALG